MSGTYGKINNNNQRFMLTEDQINLLKEAFDLFDMEKTGQIDFHELKLTLKAFGFKVSKEELFMIKKKLDPDETNKITFEQFINYMTEKFSERNPQEEAMLAFDLFDEEKKGKINLKYLYIYILLIKIIIIHNFQKIIFCYISISIFIEFFNNSFKFII